MSRIADVHLGGSRRGSEMWTNAGDTAILWLITFKSIWEEWGRYYGKMWTSFVCVFCSCCSLKDLIRTLLCFFRRYHFALRMCHS
jgi:hypothetical protein